jgi:hypothetical protein
MRGGLLRIIIFIFILAPTALVAQDVRVLVLDAWNGKPQSGVKVHYFCQSETHNFLPGDSDITDADGIAIVSYPCKEEQKIVFAVTALPKEECGDLRPATFNEISGVGIISPPDGEGEMHCPKKISRKPKPVPGQVIIFIKKPSWWQYHF